MRIIQGNFGDPVKVLLKDEEKKIFKNDSYDRGEILFQHKQSDYTFTGDLELHEDGWVFYEVQPGDFDETGFYLFQINLIREAEDEIVAEKSFIGTLEVVPRVGG